MFKRGATFIFLLSAVLFSCAKGGSKTVAIVIAHNNFRDEEFSVPYNYLLKHGINVVIASSDTTIAKGMLGMEVKPQMFIKDLVVDSLNGLIIPGGSGATVLWEDTVLINLVKEFYKRDIPIGALCLSPVLLAKAGILKNKRATVFPSVSYILKEYRVFYIDTSVVVSDNIVTASGPQYAYKFAKTFFKLLK